MWRQKVEHKKGEKKISLEKANKKRIIKNNQDIFEKVPKLIDLIMPALYL